MRKSLKEERMGQIRMNKYGSEMKVVGYHNALNILVKFVNTKMKPIHTTWKVFDNGEVKNPYDKSTYGVGFIGEGKYKPSIKGRETPQYTIWRSMLQRCYSENYQEKQHTYKGCTVISEWFCFQTFAEWYDRNFYQIQNERMQLDKDILIKGNKIYSPETCVFVPQSLNLLYAKGHSVKSNLPIGVTYIKQSNKYIARCNNSNGETVNLSCHLTPEEAFKEYKMYKEKIIKQKAYEYRHEIPTKLFQALINYKVEITD